MNALTPTRCREISEADIEAVAELLTRGFVGRSREYWMQGLRRQAARAVPQGYPRFGYMLDNDGAPVGVLLLIHASRGTESGSAIRCNLSSWYVEPAYRNYASMLTRIAQRHKDVVYINISPAHWTWPIIEAQRFQTYCRGLFVSVPALSRVSRGMRIDIVTGDTTAIDGLSTAEVELLASHARYGCVSLVCRSDDAVCPFVLLPMRIRRGWIAPPAMQLIYCRAIADYVACAGAIGRHLLARGKVAVICDANERIPGLFGLYTEARGRKYFKGPQPPRLGDLTDTELVIYGP
jgi:hypothetical protein